MRLQSDLLKVILDHIESNAKIDSENFDITYNINIKEVIDAHAKNVYKPEDVRYVIAMLKRLGYICVQDGNITKLTTAGYKFLLSLRYNINCNY